MSTLFNSSRGFVFMEMLFVLFALAWIITVYVRRLTAGQGRPYIDILGPPVGPPPVVGVVVPPPSYGIPPATSVVLGSSGNLAQVSPVYGFPGAGYIPNFFDLVLEGYEQLLLDYLPYFIIGVLNVVAFRCHAFCLVNLFLVLIPILLFNITRLLRCPIPWIIALGKFWWAGWVMGWFINFWTIVK